VVIDVEGDEWVETVDRRPDMVKEISLSREQIIQRCQENGLVGMGGAPSRHISSFPYLPERNVTC
jgi:electron transport complex protein RnfC